jgi:predicted DCC family thiol-disulfide oxidoreductase YuxK
METTRATVIYDADCGFCKWSLALLLSLDDVGRKRPEHGDALRPLPLGTTEADRLLADLTVAERNASWHLVVDSAASSAPPAAAPTAPLRFSAGAAFAPVLSLLPRGRIPAAAFARFPRTTERGYRWVVKHRGALGRFVPGRARRWADRVIAAHVEVRPQ